MAHDLYNRLEDLLRGLPEWEQPPQRRTLLSGILRHHSVWDYLRLGDSVAVAANTVIDTCRERDPDSICVLLQGLRERYRTDPERAKEIDFLSAQLCSRRHGRRGSWRGAPYPGLTPFDRQHAPIFFGREQALKQLVGALNKEQGRCFTIVLGASGSGKSSLVRAGLWASLEAGEQEEMPGSRQWLISAMRPVDSDGEPKAAVRDSLRHALQNHESLRSQCDWSAELRRLRDASVSTLAERVLSRAPAEAQWLLILDQMEELFTEPTTAGAAFLDELVQTARPGSRFRVVATLRADFYHHCGQHPSLLSVLNGDGGAFHLGPPDRRSLERMVSGPLTELDLIDDAGSAHQPRPWFLDPDLPSAIASDAERSPGGLALMAFALRELYEACRYSRRLDLETYRSASFGGLSGAIGRKADDTLDSLGSDGETTLRRVFSRLVRVNPDDAPARRRERLSAWAEDLSAQNAIDRFQKARLLVGDRDETGDPVVEVAHEALLREWPRLAQWIESEKEALQLAERVRTEARDWARQNWSQSRRRPFAPEYVDNIRQRLESAGLLGGLLEDPVVSRLLTPEAQWLLEEVAVRETTAFRRWQIGARLAEIGDPRPGTGVKDGVPDIPWRDIDGGSVEIEGHGSFPVEPFDIAAFPVTGSQFLAFVHASDGYASERWWRGLKREERAPNWDRLLPNHPATEVSWYDAVAFCRWLSVRLAKDVRLPDEQEWQWAAQSQVPGFRFPWGEKWEDGRANTLESGISRTTAVGMFPGGNSLQGVSDLTGNVWEWCRNRYADPNRTDEETEEPRVLRGGSWGSSQGGARAGYRNYGLPNSRSSYVGFRVVVSSPIRKRRSLERCPLICRTAGHCGRAKRGPKIFRAFLVMARPTGPAPPCASPRCRHSAHG